MVVGTQRRSLRGPRGSLHPLPLEVVSEVAFAAGSEAEIAVEASVAAVEALEEEVLAIKIGEASVAVGVALVVAPLRRMRLLGLGVVVGAALVVDLGLLVE